MNEYFRLGAAEYERRTKWTKDRQLLALIQSAIGSRLHGSQCLELASGSGRVARDALDGGVGEWITLDIEPMMLPRRAPRLSPIVGDGAQLPFRSESFACVVTWSGLHYIGARAALAEMFRVLKPGAEAVAAQKVADNLREHLDWYQQVQRARSTVFREWYFSEDLAHIGLAAGFSLASVRRYRQWHRADVWEWASRGGYFDRRTTETLLDLAARGRDDRFASETGFSCRDGVVEFPIDWVVIRWQKLD